MTDFIRAWRTQAGKDQAEGFVPLNSELDEAFQLNWSEEGLVVGGVYSEAISPYNLSSGIILRECCGPSRGLKAATGGLRKIRQGDSRDVVKASDFQ